MPSVTVPGTGSSHVTVPINANDVSYVVAQQIASTLNALWPNNLQVESISGGSSPPSFGPSTVPGELLVTGTSGWNLGTTSEYGYVVNVNSGQMTIGASNQDILSGTGGGTYFDSGNATVAAGGGSNVVAMNPNGQFNAGDRFMAATGDGNDTIWASGSGTMAGGGGANALVDGNTDSTSQQYIISNGADTISAGAGADTVGAFGSSNLVFGGSGQLVVGGAADNATVVGGSGDTTIFGATNGLYFEGTGQNTFVNAGGSDTIIASPGPGSDTVWGGTGQNVVFGSTGSLEFVGGTGSSTIVGGTTTTTVFGSSGTSVTFFGGSAGGVLAAGAGSETLDGGVSTHALSLAAGTGSDSLVGGSGNDQLFAGTGSATMTGGAGSDLFAFAKGAAGGSDVITDFQSNDLVVLNGYGANAGTLALATATVSAGSTTVLLSDNTKITFANVTSLNSSNFHSS